VRLFAFKQSTAIQDTLYYTAHGELPGYGFVPPGAPSQRLYSPFVGMAAFMEQTAIANAISAYDTAEPNVNRLVRKPHQSLPILSKMAFLR